MTPDETPTPTAPTAVIPPTPEPTTPVVDVPVAIDPRPLHDPRADEDAVEGHFVDVVSGPHEGRYGVFLYAEGSTAIVKTRDNDTLTFATPISDLRPALAGRR